MIYILRKNILSCEKYETVRNEEKKPHENHFVMADLDD